MVTRLLFVRHPETDENTKDIIQGHHHGTLTEKGRMQTKQLCKRLAQENIECIISSDADRCCELAKQLSEQLKTPLEISTLIREKDNGLWNGKSAKEVDWDSLEGNFEQRHPPEGESLFDVKTRADKFMKDILSRKEHTLLIVSHGVFLKVLIGMIFNMNLKDSIFKLGFANASVTEVVNNSTGFHVTTINDTAHL